MTTEDEEFTKIFDASTLIDLVYMIDSLKELNEYYDDTLLLFEENKELYSPFEQRVVLEHFDAQLKQLKINQHKP